MGYREAELTTEHLKNWVKRCLSSHRYGNGNLPASSMARQAPKPWLEGNYWLLLLDERSQGCDLSAVRRLEWLLKWLIWSHSWFSFPDIQDPSDEIPYLLRSRNVESCVRFEFPNGQVVVWIFPCLLIQVKEFGTWSVISQHAYRMCLLQRAWDYCTRDFRGFIGSVIEITVPWKLYSQHVTIMVKI